jgi:DNA-binding NtrC family response regulator
MDVSGPLGGPEWGKVFGRGIRGTPMDMLGRILLADDEEDFLRYTAALFEREGYACDCAKDAPTAVQMLRARRYDAVISDIRMPGNSDLRLAREAPDVQADIPVILVTAYPSMDSAVRAVELPVRAYVEKPVEFRELLSKVRDAILETRAQKQAVESEDCRLGRCGKLDQVFRILSETAVELRSTKKAFKSKKIGRLRQRIEAFIDRLKTELN